MSASRTDVTRAPSGATRSPPIVDDYAAIAATLRARRAPTRARPSSDFLPEGALTWDEWDHQIKSNR